MKSIRWWEGIGLKASRAREEKTLHLTQRTSTNLQLHTNNTKLNSTRLFSYRKHIWWYCRSGHIVLLVSNKCTSMTNVSYNRAKMVWQWWYISPKKLVGVQEVGVDVFWKFILDKRDRKQVAKIIFQTPNRLRSLVRHLHHCQQAHGMEKWNLFLWGDLVCVESVFVSICVWRCSRLWFHLRPRRDILGFTKENFPLVQSTNPLLLPSRRRRTFPNHHLVFQLVSSIIYTPYRNVRRRGGSTYMAYLNRCCVWC